MKILWSIFISVLVFYTDSGKCEDFIFDTNETVGNWEFSTKSYVYGQDLTELAANIEEDRPNLKMPDNFWNEFDTGTNDEATGIWAYMYHKLAHDRSPSITFTLPTPRLLGNISLSYFIYGDGFITVSPGFSSDGEIFDNCQDRPPEVVTTTTELAFTETTEWTSTSGPSLPTTTEATESTITTTTTAEPTDTPANMTCNTDNRQWTHTTVDFINCNETICAGVSRFTVTFHFKDDFANEANEGFIFLEKIVATEHFPTPPTEPPAPTPKSTTTTTTSTPKATESTTESLSTSLIPGFLMTLLTTSALFLTT